MPGKFDMAFNSHQIFHVAVVAAAFVHYKAVMSLLDWRDASGGCALLVRAGPVRRIVQDMQDLNNGTLGIDQVHAMLLMHKVVTFNICVLSKKQSS